MKHSGDMLKCWMAVWTLVLINADDRNLLKSEDLQELEENDAKLLIQWYNANIVTELNREAKAVWAYSTDMTPENENIMIKSKLAVANFTQMAHRTLSLYEWQNIKDANVKRQLKQIFMPGLAALSEDKLKQLLSTEAQMLKIHSKAAVCRLSDDMTPICMDDKDITSAFSRTFNEPSLRHLWALWHDNLGRKMRQPFIAHVQLSNEMAVGNNYSNLGEMWRSSYEWPNLENDVEQLWQQIKPLYLQLHAYTRRHLRQLYGIKHLPNGGLIPAHLIGDLFSYDWGRSQDPFPNISHSNITRRMQMQNYSVQTIVEVAENFFVSLGFPQMSSSFWKNSILQDPGDGRKIMCHGTAWDFHDQKDFRILICAEVTAQHLYTIHHEMGHIHYFMQYKQQPFLFRGGANPAFHEAIGDLILLSVMTPKHLDAIGLLESYQESRENDINFLFAEAISTVAPLPSNYLIDRWRWDIFSGEIKEADWNDHWWRLKKEIQGFSPPTKRKSSDLDAGVIFHVATFSPFIRYFLSAILKYQFHRSLCKTAGEYEPGNPEKPLFKCDIYGSKETGDLLKEMLQLGASKDWRNALKIITKEDKFDGSALLEYFQPLMDYLTKDNAKHEEIIGWESPVSDAYEKPQAFSCSCLLTVTKFVIVTLLFLSFCAVRN